MAQAYEHALRLQHRGELDDAHVQYHALLAESEQQRRPNFLRLRYCCFKNLALIEQQKGHAQLALQHYLQATTIDGADVVLWYESGRLAESVDNLRLARYAFEQGLACNPKHWLCLVRLLDVLALMQDDIACMRAVNVALSWQPAYAPALMHRSRILQGDGTPTTEASAQVQSVPTALNIIGDGASTDALLQRMMARHTRQSRLRSASTMSKTQQLATAFDARRRKRRKSIRRVAVAERKRLNKECSEPRLLKFSFGSKSPKSDSSDPAPAPAASGQSAAKAFRKS
jgi:tetratricopeptide (TPR) repeat protein